MGMYTEIFFRAEVDDEATEIIERLHAGSEIAWPDHPFFECARFRWLTNSSSFYFPGANHFEMEERGYGGRQYSVSFRSNLKNYDDEIDKFFDWVGPHVLDGQGYFMGYSLYEEDVAPTLYFTKEVTND